jgi:cytochrome c oxidase subunit 2
MQAVYRNRRQLLGVVRPGTAERLGAVSARCARVFPWPVRGRLPAALVPLLLAGCGGNQDVLHGESHQERSIDTLWWVMFGAACAGFALIACLLLAGWWRRNRRELPGGGGERVGTGLVIGLGVVLPLVLLTTLFVWSDLFVLRTSAAPAQGSTAMTIDVIGHDWWWEARYAGTSVVTANEIHIPTGTPVEVVGTSADVIHSFWVPELARKIDLIPGRTNRLLLEADRPGTYRGQCSEFCGVQHAHMAVAVTAQPPAAFRRWLAEQTRPATAGGRGLDVFLSEQCASCHTIRGTPARGDVGPDLTHVASRATIAALTLPNTPDYLRGWIRDPGHFKPGVRMPKLPLTIGQLDALVAYLEQLR